VIIGEDEIEKGEFSVKNMRNGTQTQVKADELLAYIESEGSK
jgi:histidyl-tRNA synthetase